MRDVIMTRIFLREQEHLLDDVISCLKKQGHTMGYTVYRGISGEGQTGVAASSSILDLISDLPLVIEFFDAEQKVELALHELQKIVKPAHIVSWQAKCY